MSLFVWTQPSGEEQALMTAEPIQWLAPGHNRTRFEAEALDGGSFSVVTIGAGQNQAEIQLRHEPASKLMDELWRAILDKLDITLVDDETDQASAYTVKGIGGTAPRRDGETGQAELYEMTALFRRMDGGPLP